MNLLSFHLGHNATAALGIDGRVVAAVSQEKLDNVKNSAAFPGDAAEACLASAGVRRDELDGVLIAGRDVFPRRAYDYLFAGSAPAEKGGRPLRRGYTRFRSSELADVAPWLFSFVESPRRRALLAEGRRQLEGDLAAAGFGDLPRRHVEHHTCHARAAFHGLDRSGGAEPALVLTLDGSGDGIAGSVNTYLPDVGWQRLATVPVSASLGGYYSNTTRFLGMKILEHEYKVMGLAPYAKDYYLDTYERVFAGVVQRDPKNPLTFRGRVDAVRFYEHLRRNAVGERFDNVAAAIQHMLETEVTSWIRDLVDRTGISRVFTGGGVFMNVKLNQRVQELPEIEQAFFMPSCGDESNPLGAIYDVESAQGAKTVPLDNLYLGPSYTDETLTEYVTDGRLDDEFLVSRPRDIESSVAALLADGEVVARFAGRCEWGARSLGNRAILAHPGRMESFFTVNDQIKVRDFWMPFAPTILSHRAGEYLLGYDPSRAPAPHMITAYSASAEARTLLQAALHRGDLTLRPQVLMQQDNPDYFRLITEFERLTGTGAVLNTSFNLHGYPLVATPQQALFTLRNSGLRHLALGPLLLSKS